MIRQTSSQSFNDRLIKGFECISTDDIDALLTTGVDGISPLTLDDIGSSIFVVDTGEVWKLNTTESKLTLKWYKL